jgi:hypothetical protein
LTAVRRALTTTLLLASILATFTAVAEGHARDPARFSTEPGLFPDFAPAVSDYVTRCGPGGAVRVTVSGSRRTWVSVDGAWPRTGSFTASVALTEGQSFTVRTLEPWRFSSFHVRCLPSDFPLFTAQRLGRPQAQWYIASPFAGAAPAGTSLNYVGIFDTSGVPVWWYRAATPTLDAKLLRNGNIIWLQANPSIVGDASAEEHRLDGSMARTVTTTGNGSDHHEIQLLRNGDYLLARYFVRSGVDLTACGGTANATIFDNELQEVDTAGHVVGSWVVSDHVSPAEVPARWRHNCVGSGPLDVYHFNSAEADGSGIVMSFRHLDAVYRIRWRSGAIDWKLGGTPRPESLEPIGDPDLANGGFAGQHDARILPDGTLTVHDNGSETTRAPRAVRYRIDRRERTATLLEDVRDAAAPSSFCCGSARRLPGGNWVTAWGSRPIVSELTPSGSPVFRLTFTQGLFSYRADPVLYGRLSATTLRAAMDSMHPRSGR